MSCVGCRRSNRRSSAARRVATRLVEDVRECVRGVPGCRLGRKCADRQVVGLVEAALLLPDEGQQPAVPPVRAEHRTGGLDQRPGLLGYLDGAGEGDRRHGHVQGDRVPPVLSEVVQQPGLVVGRAAERCAETAATKLRSGAWRGAG